MYYFWSKNITNRGPVRSLLVQKHCWHGTQTTVQMFRYYDQEHELLSLSFFWKWPFNVQRYKVSCSPEDARSDLRLPQPAYLGGWKNIFQDNCWFEERNNNNHINSSEHVVCAPASRWHWWWCLPAWELWRRASRAPLRRPQPTNHLGPEQAMLVLVMMMMVAMVVVFLMKMLINLLMTKHDNASI